MPSEITRRRMVLGLGATSLGALALRGFAATGDGAAYFTHGIASGDPLQDRVILWTRVLPGSGKVEAIHCQWQVARDVGFTQVLAQGETSTDSSKDYIVKVDATGLAPGSDYYYRFVSRGVTSPIGRTRTMPEGDVKTFRIGLASCSNYPQGYFNAYHHMAQTDLDVVLHLGDYIYEYAAGIYANPVATDQLYRQVKPRHEIVSLDDYRTRYGLYRSDPDLQAVHARHPFICVWDDHELANDTWKAGAENHNKGEGDFDTRMRHARQAYHEWLPIRTGSRGEQGPIYRRFSIGKLADLIMLDTRLHGRDQGLNYLTDAPPMTGAFAINEDGMTARYMGLSQDISEEPAHAQSLSHVPIPFDYSGSKPQPVTDFARITQLSPNTLPKHWRYRGDMKRFRAEHLNDAQRSILGEDQERWLAAELAASNQRGAVWQVLGQQVLMGALGMPQFSVDELQAGKKGAIPLSFFAFMREHKDEHLPLNLDAWDGYHPARERLYEQFLANDTNPLVVAGDTHNAWAFNLANDEGRPVGIEIATPGISSPGMERYFPVDPVLTAAAMQARSPQLVACDTSRRGWTEIELTPEAMRSRWHFVSTVLRRDYTVESTDLLVSKAGSRTLHRET